MAGQSVLENSGHITLYQGGDFKDQSTITNSGTIEVAGGTLDVQVDIANAGGIIRVDDTDGLKLNGSTINGGTITGSGTVDVTADSSINGTSAVAAIVDVSGVTIESGIVLTLDDVAVSGTAIADGGQIDVGSATATGMRLTLDDASSITGGKLVFGGSSDKVFVGAGGATLDDVVVSGGGEIAIGSLAATGVDADAGRRHLCHRRHAGVRRKLGQGLCRQRRCDAG